MSETQPTKTSHRGIPTSEEFTAFITSKWSPRDAALPPAAEVASYAAVRRQILAAHCPDATLVIPAGGLKVRSNDCDYQFRPHTAFAYFTGLGTDQEPDAVLVVDTHGGSPNATLYFRPDSGREGREFFADSRYGEFWVGQRPTLEWMSAHLDLTCKNITELRDDLGDADSLRVIRDACPDLTAMVDGIRGPAPTLDEHDVDADANLARICSTLRLTKDEWEIGQMQLACDGTAEAFTAVVRQFPEAVARGRGERWVEGIFGLYARHHGNGVGYDSICAAGDHANTLHWIKNTGEVKRGDLILIDAGIEVDSLFTADVTRTLPISGTFTDVQRRIYDAVFEAQSAGIDACRPGNRFSDVHAAAMKVIAGKLEEWGLLPDGVTAEETLDPERGGWHRRWMVHGTSHHLGIDVHDCSKALREDYMDGILTPGMIITVEPGLYFKADDLLAPEEFRGIGVRIEDDILITEEGCRNLSDALPRSSHDVEAWMAKVWQDGRVL